jgi:hypothetical protein
MVDAAEILAIDTILGYCGFSVDANRLSIAEDGLESFADMLSLTEKDIGSLAKGFAERTAAQGRIIFGYAVLISSRQQSIGPKTSDASAEQSRLTPQSMRQNFVPKSKRQSREP